MKRSDINHLRRLLGWVRCDIGQSPAELQQTMIEVADDLGHPEISQEAKVRVVEAYRRAESVPLYVRAAVKALEKVLSNSGHKNTGNRPHTRAALASAPVAGEAQEPVAWMLARRIRNSDPKFTLADPSGIYESVYAPLYSAPQASTAPSPIGYVDPAYVAARQRGMRWNAKIYDAPTQEATAPLYAAPQASTASDALAAKYAARYQYLRNHPLHGSEEATPCIRAADNDPQYWALTGEAADEAIDAAIAAQQGEGGEA